LYNGEYVILPNAKPINILSRNLVMIKEGHLSHIKN
jgi:hypothetical protein